MSALSPSPGAKPVEATCVHCGRVSIWDHDKSLDVPCPTCHAAVGHPCKRPSGHRAPRLHQPRTQLAFDTGAEPACPCQSASAQARQVSLFDALDAAT